MGDSNDKKNASAASLWSAVENLMNIGFNEGLDAAIGLLEQEGPALGVLADRLEGMKRKTGNG